MRVSGGGVGGVVARRMNCGGRETCGGEVGCANVRRCHRRGWECENGSDVVGRGNGMSDRWKGSCPLEEVSENGGVSDIVVAWRRRVSLGGNAVGEKCQSTYAASTAAPAFVPLSVVAANATTASSATATPPPTAATVRPLGALSLANFVESLPAIALC